MRGKRVCACGKVDESWRVGLGNLIPAHAIEDDHYDATHDTPLANCLALGLLRAAAELAPSPLHLVAAATVYTFANKFATARLLVGARGGSR